MSAGTLTASRSLIAAALVVLTLGGLALRMWGIGFLLPHDLEGDARILFQIRVLRGVDPEGRRNAHFGQYPLLYADIERLLPAPEGLQAPLERARSRDEHLERASALALRGRKLIAVLATLLVPITFALARTFLSAPSALLAAAFVATSPLHLAYSQQARPHAASASFALLAVWAAIALVRRGSALRWIAAGTAGCLAFGALHSGIACVIPLACAAILRWRADGRRALWWSAAVAILFALAIPLFYPFVFDPSSGRDAAQLEMEGAMIEQAGHKIDLEAFRGGGFLEMVQIFWDHEPWLLVAGAVGLLLLLSAPRRVLASMRRPELLVLGSYALSYLVALGLYNRTVARFCTPLVPFAAMLSSWALIALARALKRVIPAPAGTLVGAALVLVFAGASAGTGARQSWVRTQPDTEELAARWIEEHLDPRKDRLATLGRVSLPLFRKAGGLPPDGSALPLDWWGYEPAHRGEVSPRERWDIWTIIEATSDDHLRALEHPQRFLEHLDADVIVLQTMRESHVSRWLNKVTNFVRANHELLVRISPDSDPLLTDAFLNYVDPQVGIEHPQMAWRLWRARGVGPVIEIYAARGRGRER